MLTLNKVLTENKNTIHFKQRLLPNCLPHDLETVTMNGGENTSQYHTPLTVTKFTWKRKKIKSGYFIAASHSSLKRLEEQTFLACAVITHCSRHSCYIQKKKSIESKIHG